MENKVFTDDIVTKKELVISKGAHISDVAKTITENANPTAIQKGEAFAKEIEDLFVSDFEKPGDKMAHVSTFIVIDDVVYMTYYANTKEPSEDPKNQTARLVYAPVDDIENKTFIDLQTTGDMVGGKTIDMVYDTILMQKDSDTIYVMWTARTAEGNYYRFYCPFTLSTKTLGNIGVNRFKVGNVTNDFSVIKTAVINCCNSGTYGTVVMLLLSEHFEKNRCSLFCSCISGYVTHISSPLYLVNPKEISLTSVTYSANVAF